jgi:hypothetical protein
VTTTTGPATPTTTAASETTTTAATPVTTTTSAGARVTAYTVTGGTVVIRFDGTTESLVSATPNPGYQVEIGSRGPDEVSVEFEGASGSSHLQAEVSDGELVIDREDDD